MNYPKFQYSYFIKNGAQIVVRGDEYDKFVEWVKGVQVDFPADGEKVAPRATTAPQTSITGKMCEVHKIDMKERISKKTGKPYNAHYKKNSVGWDTCFGKGWLSEQEGQSSEEIFNE